MYKKELDNLINSNNLPNFMLLFGDCPYFINEYSKKIANSIDKESEKLIFYFDEYDFSSAKNYLSQTSLFGDKNILIIKSEKKINAKELKIFIELTSKIDDSYFIFEFYNSDFKTTSKAFGKNFVRFFKPSMYEARVFLEKEANRLNINIDRYALEHLFVVQNLDLALSINELKKFSIFDTKITTKDIDNLTFGVGEINLDDLIFKIFTKQEFIKDLKTILEREDEIRILTAVSNFINTIFMFNLYYNINGFFSSKEVLGYQLPKHIEEKRFSIAQKLNFNSFKKIFDNLQDCELSMKTEVKIDKSAILYSTLIKLQSFF